MATIKKETREVVDAVSVILDELDEEEDDDVRRFATYADLMKKLKLDKSAISRRVREAIDLGYLRNAEERKGRPAKLRLGDPLPHEKPILPTVEALQRCIVEGGTEDPPPRRKHRVRLKRRVRLDDRDDYAVRRRR